MTLKPDLGRKKGRAVQGHQWTGNQGAVDPLPKTSPPLPDHTSSFPHHPTALGLPSPKELTHLSHPTGYKSGWWCPKKEGGVRAIATSSHSLGHTKSTHGDTIYAADAFPQESALCEVKTDVQSSSRLVRPGLTPSLRPPMPNT